ncbi:MAG: two-partner secretion domain-containing protein [Thainema sp.]
MSCFEKIHIETIAGLLVPIGLSLVWGVSVSAQVTPDGTLSTTVSRTGSSFTINNGSRVGNNLFHSFSQFSVPTNGAAIFNNAANVQTIFSRVTGGSASNIDGLIQTKGNADLFLLNPSGILFGPNASLNIGGSFVASTADSILFDDGTQFSATNTTASPLLTVSVPVGLQLGANAEPIRVEGMPANNFFFRTPTLSMPSNQMLALIGGTVDIDSANIIVPDGHVELWALQNGTVDIPTTGNWQLSSLSPSPTWGDVTLRQSSYINASGTMGGAINIRGRSLTLQNGSHIESSTYGVNNQGQGINVQTTEFVDVLGASHPDNYLLAGLATNVSGSGATGGNIQIDTQRLRVNTGAWISSITSGTNLFTSLPVTDANTGQIIIHATDVEVQGYNPTPNAFGYSVSAIATMITGGERNNGGAMIIDADRVRVLDGARLTTDVIGPLIGPPTPTIGNAGSVVVTARESLEIRGTNPAQFHSGIASSIQLLGVGEAGDIEITAGQLSLSNGGTITSGVAGNSIAANAGQGAAGNITIRANDVQVSDPIFDPFSSSISGITVSLGQNSTAQGGNINLTANRLRVFNGGQITSSSEGDGPAGSVNLRVRDIDVKGISSSQVNGQFLPSTITAAANSSFNAGSVNIRADRLQVRDGAEVTVSNSGTGDAGNLNVWARNIFLDNGGSLQAEVNGGGQGNIRLYVDDLLVLRHGSSITTNAQGASTGGNISIDAGFVVAVADENSDIIANAIEGNGGNIDINTQGIFGLEFRDQLTLESDITASSQFGVSGTVQINTINTDPSSGVIELPEDVADPSQQIATGCTETQGSQFIATGRGGVPQNPTQQVNRDRTWEDVRDLSAYRQSENAESPAPTTVSNLIETTSWRRNANGQVELIAEQSAIQQSTFATCSSPAIRSGTSQSQHSYSAATETATITR